MSAMSLKYLENFPSHYWKSYKILKDHFHNCPFLYDIGDESFQSKVVQVLSKRETLKILGIGSGKGELDCINMRRMLTRFPRIDNTVVEPSVEAMEVYKSLVSGDLSDRVSTTWYQETFQQYQQRRKSNNATDKFHFISAVHSLYYADKDGSTIEFLLDLLEKDGILFIAIQNDDSGLLNFIDKVATSCGPQYNNPTRPYTTSQVSKLLHAGDGIPIFEVLRSRHQINVTPCFETESPEGSLMLDFLTHVVDFKSTVSSDVLQVVLDYLKSPDCSEILRNGKVILNEDWDTVIIRKK